MLPHPLHVHAVQVDRLLEALAIWQEETAKHTEHLKLCTATGKEVRAQGSSVQWACSHREGGEGPGV